VSSLRERRVLARTEAGLRRVDADLGGKLDLFAALARGEAMPHTEHLARRVLFRPLAALVVTAWIAILAATGFAMATPAPYACLPAYPKALAPSAAQRGAIGRLVHIPSCQTPPRAAEQPAANR
jgi:hypothetical protein